MLTATANNGVASSQVNRSARNVMLLHEFNWKNEVIQSAEPVLVDFWAAWCGPCRAMNPTLESIARDYKVCKVNVDTNQALAQAYNISAIPALLIFKNGTIVARHEGVVSEQVLRMDLSQASNP